MATIPGLSTLASPASSALFWIYDAAATPADRSHSIAALASRVKRLNREFRIETSGGAISLSAFETENLILTYNGASVVTLPQASTCIGYKVRIIAAYPGAALVTITPHTDDHIELQAANVSIFLNNSDGSANVSKFQHVDLIAVASGYWAVIGGNYCPDQSTDTDGSHLNFGRLHHFPNNNAESRRIFVENPPSASSWSSAIQAGALVGIPAKAKAIRVRVYINNYHTAAGLAALIIALSDNDTHTPGFTTSHAMCEARGYGNAAGQLSASQTEVDVPLDASGNFYLYTYNATNITPESTSVQIMAVGYYMGD